MDEHIIFSFWLAFSIFLGLCLGSFATALIYRIPRDISWIRDVNGASRSCCPSCKTQLTALDLVPFFSWLILRGRCRHCGQNISPFYPLVELLTALCVCVMALSWGPSWLVIPVLLSNPFLVSAIVIDWEHMILPDELNIALFILAMLYVLLGWQGGGDSDFLLDSLIASVVLTLVFLLVSAIVSVWKKRNALGMGDLKFLPSAGLFLGLSALPSYIMLAGFLGIVTAFLKSRAHPDEKAFPFGPALIISLYIHLFLTGLGFDYMW